MPRPASKVFVSPIKKEKAEGRASNYRFFVFDTGTKTCVPLGHQILIEAQKNRLSVSEAANVHLVSSMALFEAILDSHKKKE